MKFLLLYSGHDGHTHKIISFIAQAQKENIQCDVVALSAMHTKSIDLSSYQKIMIGASVRYGHFNTNVERFIRENLSVLQSVPTAFFGVNLTARKAEKSTPETNAYMRKFLAKTPLHFDLCAVFAGALHYPQYRWFDRVMIQFIMRMTKGETDTTKDIEYTDWNQVEYFAQQFACLIHK